MWFKVSYVFTCKRLYSSNTVRLKLHEVNGEYLQWIIYKLNSYFNRKISNNLRTFCLKNIIPYWNFFQQKFHISPCIFSQKVFEKGYARFVYFTNQYDEFFMDKKTKQSKL